MKLFILAPLALYLAHTGSVSAQESSWGEATATGVEPVPSIISGSTEAVATATDSAEWEGGGLSTTPAPSATSTSTTNSSAPTGSAGLVAGPNEVIVAPKQGDLRMVPFNINVAQGQNITFIFGAGPHTVTQSSLLTICNASTVEGAFKSGMQDAGFRFPVTVSTNETQSYYCGVATHCQKGMFGLINGLTVAVPQQSFEEAIPKMAENNTELKSLWDETKTKCEGNDRAWAWGNNLRTDQIAPDFMLTAMENILWTRQYYAENPSALPSATATGTNPSSTADKGSSSTRSFDLASPLAISFGFVAGLLALTA